MALLFLFLFQQVAKISDKLSNSVVTALSINDYLDIEEASIATDMFLKRCLLMPK